MAQATVQPLHHGPVRPFLGREHRRRAVFAAEGVVDVAEHRKGAVPEPPVHPGQIHAGDVLQRAAGGDKGLAPSGVKPGTTGRRAAAAAVVGGAAPQSHQKVPGALVQSVQKQLPYAKGGGFFGVVVRSRQRQPRAGGHLHHRRSSRQQTVKSGMGQAQGPCGRRLHPLPAQGGKKGLHSALAAVGHREGKHPDAGRAAQNGLLHHPTHLPGGQGPLEGIGDQNNGIHRGDLL